MVPGGVFLTSLAYWGNPHSSLCKTIDITYVLSSFLYQCYYAYSADHSAAYFTLSVLTMCFYPASYYYYNRGYLWESVYIHSCFQVMANITLFVLYSGKITQ